MNHEVKAKVLLSVVEFSATQEAFEAPTCDHMATRKGWKPPALNYIKLNTNAAVFDDGRVGCGGIMRDHLGEVMGATCVCIEGNFCIDVAEAFAARHSLKISLEAGLRMIVLKSDCLNLTTHLQKGLIKSTSFGNLVADILQLYRDCIFFSCMHVKRANKVAHKLAHMGKNFNEMRVWLEEVLVDVHPLVTDDLDFI